MCKSFAGQIRVSADVFNNGGSGSHVLSQTIAGKPEFAAKSTDTVGSKNPNLKEAVSSKATKIFYNF